MSHPPRRTRTWLKHLPAALLAVIVAFIAQRWQADNVSALLFVPYACWVAFATLLNASIVRLNQSAA